MPLRGESVGTAYIRLIADGSGVPDDIRDAVDGTEHVWEDAGHRDGEAYRKSLAEELEKHDNNDLSEAFARAIASDKATEQFFASSRWSKVKSQFEGEFGQLGTSAADSIEREFKRKGSLDGLADSVEGSVGRINRDVELMIKNSEKNAEDAGRTAKTFEDNLRETVENNSRRFTAALEGSRASLRRLRTDADHSGSIFSHLGIEIDNIADGVGRAFGKGSRNDFLNFVGSFVSNSVRLLALPAKLLGNISEFATGFQKASAEGQKFFAAVTSGFTAMAKDAEGASTGLSALFEGGPAAMIAGVVLLGAALAGVVAVLSTVASLISGIVAALVAMASTIAFAVVGAIVPLVGLLPPLALGLGAIVAGVVGLDDKTKKMLKEAIQPLIDGFKELGVVARSGFFEGLGSGLDRLGNSLKGFIPVFHAIGLAFGDLTRRFENLGQKAGPLLLFQRLQTFAPKVLHDLGRIVLNLTRAFSNLFVDSMPSVNNFLDFLIRITREFRQWVNANPGAIKKFFKEAGHSANVFGDFVHSVIRLVNTLLDQGRKVGNQIFGDLSKNINQFTDSIKPTGGKTVFDEAVSRMGQVKTSSDGLPKTNPLESWFERGHGVAQQLGDIAIALGKIFDALDNPQGQENLGLILEIMTKLGALAGPLAFISNLTFESINTFLLIAGSGAVGISLTAKAIGKIGDGLANIGDIHLPNLNPLKDFLKGTGGSGGVGTLTIRPPSLDWIPGTLSRIRSFVSNAAAPFANISTRWNSVMSGVADKARSTADSVAHTLISIPARLNGLAGRFAVAAAGWTLAILHEFVSLPGEIAGLFKGLGQLIANAIGSIHIPVHFDVPSGFEKFLGPGGLLLDRATASGGMFDGAQFRLIGEAGPEAVVPLSGPLSQVDPSVRWLSQIARGMVPTSTSPSGTGPGKTINNEWHITTPTEDTRAVANELLNAMVATAY